MAGLKVWRPWIGPYTNDAGTFADRSVGLDVIQGSFAVTPYYTFGSFGDREV
jgi:hypothetical protein